MNVTNKPASRRPFLWMMIGLLAAGCGNSPSIGMKSREKKALNLADTSAVTVKVGDELFADMEVHESVGTDADCEISDPLVLGLIDAKLTYTNPDRMKPGITGGDAALRRYRFRALKAGTVELKLIVIFRGEVESSRIVSVTVK